MLIKVTQKHIDAGMRFRHNFDMGHEVEFELIRWKEFKNA